MPSLRRTFPHSPSHRPSAASGAGCAVPAFRALLALGLLTAFPPAASAAEFFLHHAGIAHDASTESVAYGTVAAEAPANWKSPEDYAAGILHIRLEVDEKPGATGVMAQVCLEQDGRAAGRRACGRDFAFFEKGVYQWSQPLAEFQGAPALDWTRKPQELVLILKDCFAKPVTSATRDWVGSPFLTLYYPMRTRLAVVAVSRGGTFSGWPTAIRRLRRPPVPGSAFPGAGTASVRPDGREAGGPFLASGHYFIIDKAAGGSGAMPPAPAR